MKKIIDTVFERLAFGCPLRTWSKKGWCCQSHSKLCCAKNCGPYHWFRG